MLVQTPSQRRATYLFHSHQLHTYCKRMYVSVTFNVTTTGMRMQKVPINKDTSYISSISISIEIFAADCYEIQKWSLFLLCRESTERAICCRRRGTDSSNYNPSLCILGFFLFFICGWLAWYDWTARRVGSTSIGFGKLAYDNAYLASWFGCFKSLYGVLQMQIKRSKACLVAMQYKPYIVLHT